MTDLQENKKQVLQCDNEVLAHKKQIDSAKLEVLRVQSAITECQKCIEQASASIPVMPDRKSERSGIMADIALGYASRDALAIVDEKIASEIAVTMAAKEKVAQVIADNQSILEGLLKKLEIAQCALGEIKSRTNEVAERYFMGMADIASAQYLNHAAAMKELYQKLAGLAIAIKKHGGRNVVISGDALMIPKFSFPRFNGVVGFPANEPSMIVNGNFYMYGDYFRQAADKEEAIFSSLLNG